MRHHWEGTELSLWSHSNAESTVNFVGERRGHDQSKGLDKLGVQLTCIFIFFDHLTWFSTGSMMQNQTQQFTPDSMNSGRVPVSCSTSFCVSAKAHPDTEIFRISLSIILMKHFCFPSELTQQLLLFLAMKHLGSTWRDGDLVLPGSFACFNQPGLQGGCLGQRRSEY